MDLDALAKILDLAQKVASALSPALIAVFAIAAEAITVWYFYRELKDSKSEGIQIAIKMATSLDLSSSQTAQFREALVKFDATLNANSAQMANFISYQKGKSHGGDAD